MFNTRRAGAGLAGVLCCAAVLSAATPSRLAGQSLTSPQACALDTLVLLSPDSNGVRVRLSAVGGRRGAVVQWARLDPSRGTCVVPVDTAGLPFRCAVTGNYLDEVDREFTFNVDAGGLVGDPRRNRVIFSWSNRFLSLSGRVQGEINVSNNGGVWRLDGGAWGQVNAGLPMSLPTTNALAFAQSGADPARLWLHLGGQGLWTRTGAGDWTRVAADHFPNSLAISGIATSPSDPLRVAVATTGQGLSVSTDGGATFTRHTTDLDPGVGATFQVTALDWAAGGTLWVSVRNVGIFISTDGGGTFQRLPALTVPSVFGDPGSPQVAALVNGIATSPIDPAVVYFALRDYGAYRSTDGGQSWAAFGGAWRRADDSAITGPMTVLNIAPHPSDAGSLLAGTSGYGLFRTSDGGVTWREVAAPFVPGPNKPAIKGVVFETGSTVAWAAPLGQRLVRSVDGGASWDTLSTHPGNRQYGLLAPVAGGAGIWAPTIEGGIYLPGTPLTLSSTILPVSDAAYLNKEFGLSIAFWGAPSLASSFRLKCQDFQGYAVWRSEGRDPTTARDLRLIGLFDKTNPQTCIEGYCGDQNYIITPDCFEERRAACFNFSRGDTLEFFDDSIYNGFDYNYAVSTFDYGSTAGSDPASLTRDLVYSARFPGDANSPFAAASASRMVPFRVDLEAAPAEDGPEIYVYPNPLRRDAGFKSAEGERVVFTNLPADSRIKVWTVDGDEVAELPLVGEPQAGGNIYWNTRNSEGELLASGIYIWKVTMPARGDFYGKLVIIR